MEANVICDRRIFLSLGATALAAGCVQMPSDPVRNAIVINSCGELSDPNLWGSSDNSISRRVVQDAIASGLTAVHITMGYVSGKDEPFEATRKDIAFWDGVVAQYPDLLIKARSTKDILQAKASGKVALIFAFQNAAMMGNDASRVDVFADAGVRVIQLTYNPANQLGGGSVAAGDIPLSPFGREVIARLNARKVIVDLSHSGERTCLDATQASKTPIAITHTGCRALSDLPRNKTDQELRLVAEKGGYVGIYFMPFLSDGRQITGDDVVNHIEHAIKVCGEDAIGIGTDGGTTAIDDMNKWKQAFADDIKRRQSLGISAPGERPDSFIFAIDMNGPDQFRILASKLAKRGHSQSRIEKVLGGNFFRYAQQVWGA